jgi:3-oxoacyl-[acyl-carrier protein] reductase
MELNLHDRKVLVTGGSKGIGAACARVFLEEGCTVVLCARDAARLAQTAAELGTQSSVDTIAADLSQPGDRERVAAAHPDIDILINNAGAIPAGGLLDLPMEKWEVAWSLKVMGYIHLTQLYLGAMRARGSGVIVNIIGSAGRSPRYDYICGATGNAALMAFTGAVGAKSPEWGVRVFGINPSQTRTDRIVAVSKTKARNAFGDEARWQELLADLPFQRLIEPEEIARMAAFLSSPASSYVSGTVIDVDGGAAFRG